MTEVVQVGVKPIHRATDTQSSLLNSFVLHKPHLGWRPNSYIQSNDYGFGECGPKPKTSYELLWQAAYNIL